MTLSRHLKTDSLGNDVLPGRIYLIEMSDGSYEDVSGDDLLAAADWLDEQMTEMERDMSLVPNLQDLFDHCASWRNVLDAKEYVQINCTYRYDPMNDEFKISLYMYNSDWSSVHLPDDMSKGCGRFELGKRLADVTAWVASQPHEAEAREQALLRDFAAIKERIAKSRLADVLEAEAQALMDKLTTNILTDQSARTVHEVEALASEGPEA